MSEGQLLSFWLIECLSLSLTWHQTPGQVENVRGRIFYRALQPPGSWSAWAAATKHQGPMAYKQQTLLSHSSVSWKSEVREAAWASSATSPLPGVRLPTSPCILTWRGPRGAQAHPGLQENRRTLLSSPPLSLIASQRCHLLGVGAQLMDLGGHKPSVHNCLQYHSLLP